VLLVLRGPPAAVDQELDPVDRGIGRSPAQGTEQIRVEVGYTRALVIEDRRSVGDGTAGLAKHITVLTAKDVDGRCDRPGRGRRPTQVAQGILAAVDAAQPPRRLALSSPAAEVMRAALDARLHDLDQRAPVAGSGAHTKR
jgi:hypothetical protein